jgi:hypothetical protein
MKAIRFQHCGGAVVTRWVFACRTGEYLPQFIAVPGAALTPLRGFLYHLTLIFAAGDRTFADMINRNRSRGRTARADRTRQTGENDILKGWKEIAGYLHCGQKTAYRWWKERGLPILTAVSHTDKAPILASKRALDAWLKGGIEHALISNSKLTVLDKQARLLWSHEFSDALRDYRPEEAEWRLRIVDLGGAGERGILFAAKFLSPSVPETLFHFSSEGKIIWQLEAAPPLLNRGGTPFERAWAFKHVVITGTNNDSTVWAALGNDAGWAGCVLRIGANGEAAVHFANAGYVERLCPVTLPAGDFLIVCGENNDYDQAFVALLSSLDPAACSVPGPRLVYRFSNAPTGRPPMYILFPQSEVVAARLRPYGHATNISQHLDGIIIVVETGEDGAHLRYHFSKDLEPRYVFPSGNHEFAHKALEKTGAITHTWLDCPEMQAPLILRIWEPDSGWYDRRIPWRDNPWKEVEGSAL